ncbi:MAG TPA: hypothetical protein VFS35_02150, partial [Terrimicrobiaceae bacterium]|nr:hypothetical protein [Terrimicrobiaceae bacterium]
RHVCLGVSNEPPLSSSKAAARFDIIWLSGQGLPGRRLGCWLLALSGAAAFTFAAVLALASVVASLAASLAFTGVFSFALVSRRPFVSHRLEGNSR